MSTWVEGEGASCHELECMSKTENLLQIIVFQDYLTTWKQMVFSVIIGYGT